MLAVPIMGQWRNVYTVVCVRIVLAHFFTVTNNFWRWGVAGVGKGRLAIGQVSWVKRCWEYPSNVQYIFFLHVRRTTTWKQSLWWKSGCPASDDSSGAATYSGRKVGANDANFLNLILILRQFRITRCMQPTSSFTPSALFNYTPLVIGGDWQNTQLTFIKPTQTGINRNKYTFWIMKSSEPPKNLKTSRVPYLGLVL